jgi:hypothetical protein
MDKSKVDKLRASRNYIKFRLSGMVLSNIPRNALTPEEKIYIDRMEHERRAILGRFEYNSSLLGVPSKKKQVEN